MAVVALVAGLLFAFSGCRPATSPSGTPDGSGGATRSVVATTSVLADLVRNVGGSRVTVGSMIPPGVGPEDYEPRPVDARLLASATLIVSNGVGLDDFLDRMLTGGGEDAARLVLGRDIPSIDVAGRPNPHFWLDPTLVAQYYVPRIRDALTALDPAGAADYAAAATEYLGRIATLDQDLLAAVAALPAPARKLVSFHDAFPYLARHFGFELVGVIVQNVGQEPTASELARLVDVVRAAKVKAVFSEAQFNPALAETLAGEAGIEHVVSDLYTDALGPAPADSYLGLMRWDIDRIVEALR